MLRGMMILEPQRPAMPGQAKLPDAAQIANRAKACAKLLLNGCRASSHRPMGILSCIIQVSASADADIHNRHFR
jgi:hypothetical protein